MVESSQLSCERRQFVKDNDMEFRVSNPDERAAIIAYLKSLGK